MRVFSSGYCLESKIPLTSSQHSELEKSVQRMLQKCPPECAVRLEITSLRSDVCFNLEIVGFPMPMTAFTIGPVFSDALLDLEMELDIIVGCQVLFVNPLRHTGAAEG